VGTWIVSFWLTLYCFPAISTTAYIGVILSEEGTQLVRNFKGFKCTDFPE